MAVVGCRGGPSLGVFVLFITLVKNTKCWNIFLIDRENTGFDPDLAAVQEGLNNFLFLGWLIPEGALIFRGGWYPL